MADRATKLELILAGNRRTSHWLPLTWSSIRWTTHSSCHQTSHSNRSARRYSQWRCTPRLVTFLSLIDNHDSVLDIPKLLASLHQLLIVHHTLKVFDRKMQKRFAFSSLERTRSVHARAQRIPTGLCCFRKLNEHGIALLLLHIVIVVWLDDDDGWKSSTIPMHLPEERWWLIDNRRYSSGMKGGLLEWESREMIGVFEVVGFYLMLFSNFISIWLLIMGDTIFYKLLESWLSCQCSSVHGDEWDSGSDIRRIFAARSDVTRSLFDSGFFPSRNVRWKTNETRVIL